MNTKEKVLAFTFDGCNASCDTNLLYYLVKKHVPSTLFITGKWLQKNNDLLKKIIKTGLFEIENHGLNHKPCSVSGRSIYGIKGTENSSEVIDEIELNARAIQKIIGIKPHFFRAGTGYYDDASLAIVKALGYEAVNYGIIGDAGATFTKAQIQKVLQKPESGSIIILHMNHPESQIFAALRDIIPKLQQQGYKFVKLSEYQLR